MTTALDRDGIGWWARTHAASILHSHLAPDADARATLRALVDDLAKLAARASSRPAADQAERDNIATTVAQLQEVATDAQTLASTGPIASCWAAWVLMVLPLTPDFFKRLPSTETPGGSPEPDRPTGVA